MFVVPRHDISLELAREVAAGVRAEAAERGVAMAIAIVDSSGELVLAERMNGAAPVALHLAQDKAYTAAAFGAPTEQWAAVTAPGGADWGMAGSVGGRILVLPGGLPVRVAGRLVGGLGVSGAAPSVDVACASAGIAVADGLDPSAVLPKPHAKLDLSDKQTS